MEIAITDEGLSKERSGAKVAAERSWSVCFL
jgi:hypothetical protein